jgi:signal peptidase
MSAGVDGPGQRDYTGTWPGKKAHAESGRKLKKLLEWLGWAILVTVIMSVGFVMAAAQYGWEFDAVLSGSMEPVLAVGGLVVIKPVDASQVETGDIISFKVPGFDTPICHRVIAIQQVDGGRLFQTKGDANEEPDINPVPGEAVTGKEVFYLPYVGNLARLSTLGRERVTLMGGRSVPAAVLVIMPLGLAFIGLTLKDTLEEVFRPLEKRRKDLLKKRREMLIKRRRALG